MFNEALATLRYHLRSSKNANSCLNAGDIPAIYWNVDMYTGNRMNYWVDSLQSVWPGILVSGVLRQQNWLLICCLQVLSVSQTHHTIYSRFYSAYEVFFYYPLSKRYLLKLAFGLFAVIRLVVVYELVT